MLIRPAADADIARINAIYSIHVLAGTGTFELDVPGEAEMHTRYRRVVDGGHAWFVAEVDGTVAGYGYYGAYHARPGYRWTVENSVYVDPDHQRRGLGLALVERLVNDAEARGFRQMLAIIGDRENAGSIGVHRSAGFVHAGTLEAVGTKFGRWLDVVIMQRSLGAGAGTGPG